MYPLSPGAGDGQLRYRDALWIREMPRQDSDCRYRDIKNLCFGMGTKKIPLQILTEMQLGMSSMLYESVPYNLSHFFPRAPPIASTRELHHQHTNTQSSSNLLINVTYCPPPSAAPIRAPIEDQV